MRYLPLTLLAVACHPVPRAPAPTVPSVAQLSPGTVRYAVTGHRHVEQRFQGQPIVTDATTFLLLSVVMTASDSGLGVDVVVDSVDMTGDAVPSAALVQAAKGARFTGVAPSADGKLAITPNASADPVLDQIALGLQEPEQLHPDRLQQVLALRGTDDADGLLAPSLIVQAERLLHFRELGVDEGLGGE